ncbi:HNH endonuclease [Paraburkholderia aspalathi]|uniref:HNH endonuclease n=1 Tax=Paraburkholderia aspalathi TaxID=1324617 RepID=UPI0038BAA5EC
MRAIPKPTYVPNFVFQTCTGSVSDPGLRGRLNAISAEIGAAGVGYDNLANLGRLHEIPPSSVGDEKFLVADVTKAELKNLYGEQMIPRSKPARAIYDNLRLAAPGGKCPTCGFGQVFTIDHFLPKAKFPWFSVLPENLVPSCRDCNTGKNATAANDAQSFHPYYDETQLSQEQWIFAEVLNTSPVTVKYFVRAPQHWDDLLVQRATNHFRDYQIGSRFAVEAASELVVLAHSFTSPPMQLHAVRDALERRLRAERQQRSNSWQIALFEALRESDWFCSLQFAAVPKAG